MKCPLFWASVINSPRQVKGKHGDCIEGECAHWSTEMDQCDPTGLLPWLKLLLEVLEKIETKMPRADQFTK